jgi:hypothetical protein
MDIRKESIRVQATSKKRLKGTKRKVGATPANAPGRKAAKNPSLEARRLSLNDVTGVRKTLARFSREFDCNLISEQKLRAQVYTLRGILAALEIEKRQEVDERLDRLEKRVEELIKQKGGKGAT